jgi:hypothetical protein
MIVRTMNAKRVLILSVLVGAGIFAGAAAAGCAVIVGADGYSVDKGSGTTSNTGGSQGSGGSGGKGATGGGTGGAGGATGGAGGGTSGSTGTGGTPPPPDGGRGGMAGGPPGQDAGRDGAVPTGAGETLCMGNTCPAGQSCLMTAFSPPGLCTYSCDTVPCDADHDCVHSNRAADMFPNSCVKKCPTGVTCPTGFLCVPISTGPVCLPTGWFDGLGIGDDCFADEQCVSGICRNKPNGWCTKSCGPADPLCAHDAVNFYNRNNELNWCVNNIGGTLSCVPGCDSFGATTCALYPGTTCRMVTEVLGDPQMACLP